MHDPHKFEDDNDCAEYPPLVFLLIATTLEISGYALVRMAIYKHVGLVRMALVVTGATLLLRYGFAVNLAPVEFGQVVGLYIATLFIVWQVINLIAFRAFPNLPIMLGGTLIIAGGLIATFWRPELERWHKSLRAEEAPP